MCLLVILEEVFITNIFQVEEMIELIMQAFSEMLQSEEWISKETKKFAQEKVKWIKIL